MIIVVEFDGEICYPDGRSSGSRRGWVDDTLDPVLLEDVLSRARPVAWVQTEDNACALCSSERLEVR